MAKKTKLDIYLIIMPLVAVIIFVGGLGLFLWNKDSQQIGSIQVHPLMGEAFPNITTEAGVNLAKGFSTEEIFANKDGLLEGKSVVVNFFASWCVPCLVEHEYITALSKREDILILGIAFNDKAEDTENWLQKHGNPYDIVGHDEGESSIYLGIKGVPETFGASNKGQIKFHWSGPIDENVIPLLIKALAVEG